MKTNIIITENAAGSQGTFGLPALTNAKMITAADVWNIQRNKRRSLPRRVLMLG